MRSDIALVTASRALTIAAAMLAAVITARALGVEGRGSYFYVVTIALVAAQLANLGLPSSNAYLVARDHTAVGPLLFNSLLISIVLGPLAVGVILLLMHLSNAPLPVGKELAWAVFIAPCALFYLLSSNLLVGLQDFRRYNVVVICISMLQLTLLAGVAVASPSVHGFLAVSSICTFASCLLVGRLLLRRTSVDSARHFNLPLLRQGMGFAARAFLVLLFGYLLSRMPVIVPGFHGDIHSVGLLSVVVQFLDVLSILPASVAMVLFPQLVKTEKRHRGVRALSVAAWVLVTMAVACGVLGFIAPALVGLMFGQAFAPSAEALRWALPGVVLLSGVSVIGQYLAAAGFPISTVLAWALALAVGYALSPTEPGVDAPRNAAMALSVAYGVLAVAMTAIFAAELGRSRTEVVP